MNLPTYSETRLARASLAPLAARNFPAEAAARCATEWYRFVLEELNGLGTMLRFDAEQGGAHGAEITLRARSLVETLAWDPPAAVAQTWSFVETELDHVLDAWAPHLVLGALGGDPAQLEAWARTLPQEARAGLPGPTAP